VTAAADKIIAMALEGHSEKINKRRDKIMDNYQLQIQINNAKKIYGDVLDQYGDEEGYGTTAEIARKVYTIITWFEDNYADMDEPQRYIMATKFIIPMLQNNFRSYSEMGEIDRNTGRPVMFDELVPHQVAKMGGQPVNMVTRNESIEDQISRIDQMLTEQVDIRLYKMQLDAVVSSERATGAKKLLTDELRSIEGVTVISVEDSRDLATGADFTRFNIKFSLKGQTPRVEFVNKRLLPALRRVDGFEIKDWSPPTEITPGKKLSELALPFGGVAGALGAVRYGTGPVRTPSVSVQQVADDWATNGVMDYDRPMANADMQYHEMVDASELFPYMSKVYRNPKDAFDADYHHFIKNGPQAPVYVAVGKNGRIKITGNEDLVWFAKKSGLEQIPVFFSYQLQV